eukprot:g30.t1
MNLPMVLDMLPDPRWSTTTTTTATTPTPTAKKELNDKATEALLKRLVVLILGSTTLSDDNVSTVMQRVVLLCGTVDGKLNGGASEELHATCMECMCALFVVSRARLEKIVPIEAVGHLFSILLDAACHAKARFLRQKAVDTMEQLLQICSSDTTASFLPGISTHFARIIHQHALPQQSVGFTASCIRCWATAVVGCMEDIIIDTQEDPLWALRRKQKPLQRASQDDTSQKSGRKSLRVCRDAAWAESTCQRLAPLLHSALLHASENRDSKIQLQVFEFASSIFTRCVHSMDPFIPSALELLATIVGGNHVAGLMSVDFQIDHKHVRAAQTRLGEIGRALPRLSRAGRDEELCRAYRTAAGFVILLHRAGPQCLAATFSSNGFALLKSIFAAAAIDDAHLASKRALVVDEHGYFRFPFRFIRSTDAQADFEFFVLSLTKSTQGWGFELMDFLTQLDSPHPHQRALLAVRILMHSQDKVLRRPETLKMLARRVVNSDDWNLRTEPFLDLSKPFLGGKASQYVSNAFLVAQLLQLLGEVLSKCRACDVHHRESILAMVLYPMLEKLGDDAHPVVQQAALTTLQRVAADLNYEHGLVGLMSDNMDYIIDAICVRLPLLHEFPATPGVVRSILRYGVSDETTMDALLGDVTSAICKGIDSMHIMGNSESIVSALLKVGLELLSSLRSIHQPDLDWKTGAVKKAARDEERQRVTPMDTLLAEIMEWDSVLNTSSSAAESLQSSESSESSESMQSPVSSESSRRINDSVTTLVLKCINFAESENLYTRNRILQAVDNGLRILSTNEKALLPVVAKCWPALLQQFRDSEKTIAPALSCVCTISRIPECNEFMSTRFASQLWPRLALALKGYMNAYIKEKGAVSMEKQDVHSSFHKCHIQMMKAITIFANNRFISASAVPLCVQSCCTYIFLEKEGASSRLNEISHDLLRALSLEFPDDVWWNVVSFFGQTFEKDTQLNKIPPSSMALRFCAGAEDSMRAGTRLLAALLL